MEESTTELWDPADVREAAAHLSKMLVESPDRQRYVEDILRRYLGEPPTTLTAGNLLVALELYTGADFAGFLLGYLAAADQDPELLIDFDETLDPETTEYLHKLLALFGPDVTEAATIAEENPDGWRTLQRDVYFDVLSALWKVRLDIITYGGETSRFEETPNSLLIMARGLIDTVITAVANGGVGVLDDEQLDLFSEAVNDLATLVAEDGEGEEFTEAVVAEADQA